MGIFDQYNQSQQGKNPANDYQSAMSLLGVKSGKGGSGGQGGQQNQNYGYQIGQSVRGIANSAVPGLGSTDYAMGDPAEQGTPSVANTPTAAMGMAPAASSGGDANWPTYGQSSGGGGGGGMSMDSIMSIAGMFL